MADKMEDIKKLHEKAAVELEYARQASDYMARNPDIDIEEVRCSCPQCSHVKAKQCILAKCSCCYSTEVPNWNQPSSVSY